MTMEKAARLTALKASAVRVGSVRAWRESIPWTDAEINRGD